MYYCNVKCQVKCHFDIAVLLYQNSINRRKKQRLSKTIVDLKKLHWDFIKFFKVLSTVLAKLIEHTEKDQDFFEILIQVLNLRVYHEDMRIPKFLTRNSLNVVEHPKRDKVFKKFLQEHIEII